MDAELLKQQLTALGYFKDWTNALLVATTAALGWATTQVHFRNTAWRVGTLSALTLSIVFGIVTLALIPIIAGQLRTEKASSPGKVRLVADRPSDAYFGDHPASFYDVRPRFRSFGASSSLWSTSLKTFCWPQHVLFLLGVVS